MYENIYTYHEEIKGKLTRILFIPNFREEVTLFTETANLFSDGKIRIKGNLDISRDVHVSDAQWLLKDEGFAFHLYVTERTNEIQTPLGKELNKEFNRLLKKAKKDYYYKKKEEIRLYFYDVEKDKLSLCYKDYYEENYAYSLRRLLPIDPYCAIDKRYVKPEKSCFILGRIRKTIGLKNSKLLDFIEPVHKIELDFEKEEWDFVDYEYKRKIEFLESDLFNLLRFCISKKSTHIEVIRIKAYFKNYEGTEKEVILKFKDEIWTAFKNGDAEELRKLNLILIQKQDCTNVKFQLRLKSEVECDPSKKIDIYFENGEENYLPADWVYDNIHNCTDARGVYLGEVSDRYKFY